MAAVLAISGPTRRWRYTGPLIILAAIFLLVQLIYPSWSSGSQDSSLEDLHGDEKYEQYLEPISTQYSDGTQRFDRRRTTIDSEGGDSGTSSPEILFLVLTKDSDSWSRDNDTAPQRTVNDMLQLLDSTGLDLTTISLAIMTSSTSEVDTIMSATQQYPFARVTVLYRPPDASLATLEGKDRHDDSIQQIRRSALARLRNYLMSTALETEKHILWLDADVINLSTGIIQTMLSHSETNETAGIITAISTCINNPNYDLNSFRTNNSAWLEHAVPEELFHEAFRASFDSRIRMETILEGTSDDDLVSLTSVGGTLLYIRASLVKYGLMFPWYNVVGTTWTSQGWMGLETEGLCWAAKFLEGGGCYMLGGKHHSVHAF